VGKTNWSKDSNQFGFLTFDSLEKAGAVSRKAGYYGLAAPRLLGLPADTGANLEIDEQWIRTASLERFPSQQNALEKYAKVLESILPQEVSIMPMSGSYSIKVDDRVLVKIYADEEKIYITFRNDGLSEELIGGKKVRIGVGKYSKAFVLVYEGTKDDLNAFAPVIKEFVERHIA
jgi:hypothetical protein